MMIPLAFFAGVGYGLVLLFVFFLLLLSFHKKLHKVWLLFKVNQKDMIMTELEWQTSLVLGMGMQPNLLQLYQLCNQ